MHDIKLIRKDPDFFKRKINERNVNFDLDNLLILDKKNRELIQIKEKLEQEKKSISKKKEKSLFIKSKEISVEINKIEEKLTDVSSRIKELLSSIPNLSMDDVPLGKDESTNKELKKVGEIINFDFQPQSHYDLGKKLGLMDFDTATKTTGSRFVYLKGHLAQLERAISNFMLDIHTKEFGYHEISPPLIATEDSMYGTGQLPKFETDQFQIMLDNDKTKKFLIPTAEVILTNIVRESLTQFENLPIRYVASTACFRKEAGSYGKDTKGMIRQHQFYKVELVSIVEPKACKDELKRMTNCAEEILKRLKLPYRVVLLSSGDMGFSAEKTYDLEVWIPSEKKYREISSCSSCGQFQSRRMNARYKNKNGPTDFLGTLNGSGLAVGRTLIAIMENYQQKNGSILIPEVLRSYMQEKHIIE